jgi:hypothetical protein
MDWIKIKHKHVTTNMTDAELGKLVRFQLEVARLERPMTNEEICAFFGRKEAQKSWENVTKKHQICVDFVTKKVLEDCESVTKLRQKNKKKSHVYRSNQKNVTGDASASVTEQIREDKIREDKDIPYNPFFPILNSWNNLAITIPVIPKLKALDKNRETALRECADEDPEFFVNFEIALEKIRASEFLRGNNDQRWTATFDWTLKNYLKILEGNYDQKEPLSSSSVMSKREIAESEMIERMRQEEQDEKI